MEKEDFHEFLYDILDKIDDIKDFISSGDACHAVFLMGRLAQEISHIASDLEDEEKEDENPYHEDVAEQPDPISSIKAKLSGLKECCSHC